MSRFTKYKLYQKYETRGSQEAIPCYPNVFSIDGDGTMPLVIVEENSRDCGYTGETQPIYRWYNMPIDKYYVCDACQDAQYRWVNLPISQDWECDGTTKYYKQKKQVSVDGGSTWTDVVPPQYQRGAVYEYSSQSCGYRTRTSSGSPYCTGYDKYVDVYSQYSTDGGNTWQTTATTPTMVEHNSAYCGYVPPAYENQYLTLVARGSGAFKKTEHSGTFQYSKDEGNTWTNATSATSISVNSGDRVMFKGTLVPNGGVGTFSASTQFEAEGNPMSLLYGDNFIGQRSLSGKNYAFNFLFHNCGSLLGIDNLKLVATTLSNSCYSGMFQVCSGLTSIPSGFLPATTLTNDCYNDMFVNCSSLTSVPSDLLPATTLRDYCYLNMFNGCTSLTTAPNLPATTLAKNCYNGMFNGCTSLTTAPNLPATTLTERCYQNMFGNCTNLTSAPNILATTLAYQSCYMMFIRCENLATAPNLLATTLAERSYMYMFSQCTRLKYIKCLATNISADRCTKGWLEEVASSGTFVKSSSMSGWSTGDDGIPTNWTIQNA